MKIKIESCDTANFNGRLDVLEKKVASLEAQFQGELLEQVVKDIFTKILKDEKQETEY